MEQKFYRLMFMLMFSRFFIVLGNMALTGESDKGAIGFLVYFVLAVIVTGIYSYFSEKKD